MCIRDRCTNGISALKLSKRTAVPRNQSVVGRGRISATRVWGLLCGYPGWEFLTVIKAQGLFEAKACPAIQIALGASTGNEPLGGVLGTGRTGTPGTRVPGYPGRNPTPGRSTPQCFLGIAAAWYCIYKY
eukprot:910137-Rhodomonas_salina.2